MRAGETPLTIPGRPADPYVHLDNRGLVVFDGRRCVSFPENTLGWVRETLDLLIEEKRATRHRGDTFLGGFVSEDGQTVTLYGGPVGDMATLDVSADAIGQLRTRLHGG